MQPLATPSINKQYNPGHYIKIVSAREKLPSFCYEPFHHHLFTPTTNLRGSTEEPLKRNGPLAMLMKEMEDEIEGMEEGMKRSWWRKRGQF